jgi:hypothetical protein
MNRERGPAGAGSARNASRSIAKGMTTDSTIGFGDALSCLRIHLGRPCFALRCVGSHIGRRPQSSTVCYTRLVFILGQPSLFIVSPFSETCQYSDEDTKLTQGFSY